MSEAERIAGELTEAQKRAMTRGYQFGEPTAILPGDPQLSTLGALAKAGLLAEPAYSRRQKFTPLGLEVKRILEGEG